MVHDDAWYEAEREKYKPDRVRVLLIGESRPRTGKFFYTCDSLTGAVMDAFHRVCAAAPREGQAFLRWFQALGFYLDDLCHEPVNGLEKSARQNKRQYWQADLVTRLGEMKPSCIVVIMKGVVPSVEQALAKLPHEGPQILRAVPFPFWIYRERFRVELAAVLQELKVRGIVAYPPP